MGTAEDGVRQALEAINAAWVEGRPGEMASRLHDEVVMVFPGFQGQAAGRPALIQGFEEFCSTARIHGFEARDWQVQVVAGTGVATFRFTLDYERAGTRFRSQGRDLWIFREDPEDGWLAIWRTMLEVSEGPHVEPDRPLPET